MNQLDLVTGGALRGPLSEGLFSAPPLETLPPGTEIGRYRLGDVIGRGGSGVVYRAERNDGAFEQVVALKVVARGAGDRAAALAERNLLACLSHPNIATIHDGGETAGGALWFAMDPVPGEHIDAHCRSRCCDWGQRVRLLIQVCRAIHYAHSHLIVHCDIKPSNVIVTPDGESKLVDFGIATREHAQDDQRGFSAFTPNFASPEQCTGGPVTTASDIYQLGLLSEVLLEPVAGEGVMRKAVRSDLHCIVRRATSADPAARYSTAGELASDLDAVLHCRPIAARAGSPTHRFARFIRRHTIAAAIVAALVAVLVGAVALFTVRLEQERDRAEEEARASRVTADFLRSMFRLGSPGGAGRPITVTELLDQSAHRLIGLSSLAPKDRAALVEVLADSYLELGLQQRAADMLAAAAKDSPDAIPGVLRARLLLLSARSRIPGDVAAAQREVAAAEDLLGSTSGRDRTALVLGVARARAAIDRHLGRNEAATKTLEIAIAAARDRGPSIELAYALDDLGSLYSTTDRSSAAIEATRESFELFTQLLGPASEAALSTQLQLVFHLQAGGLVDEARAVLAEQDAIVRATSGDRSLQFANLLGSRGQFELRAGDVRAAIPYLRQKIELMEAAGLGDSAKAASARNNLAIALAQVGDLPEAIEVMRKAVETIRRHSSERDQVTLMHQFNFAIMLCMGGDWQGSAQLFDTTMATYVEAFGPRNWHAAAMAKDVAGCLADAGRTNEARQLLGREVTPARWADVPPGNRPEYEQLFQRVDLPLPGATE